MPPAGLYFAGVIFFVLNIAPLIRHRVDLSQCGSLR